MYYSLSSKTERRTAAHSTIIFRNPKSFMYKKYRVREKKTRGMQVHLFSVGVCHPIGDYHLDSVTFTYYVTFVTGRSGKAPSFYYSSPSSCLVWSNSSFYSSFLSLYMIFDTWRSAPQQCISMENLLFNPFTKHAKMKM